LRLSETNKAVKVFDVNSIRKDFPILHQKIHGKDLCYFDNAATTQKPRAVINKLNEYYVSYNSNIHRGVHTLSEKATKEFEAVRDKVQKFINAKSRKEIIFTRGTTESINLVASTFGRQNIQEGDEIIISGMEHHSNIVPWQLLANEKKAVLKVIPFTDEGELIMDEYRKLLSPKTKIVSVVYVSNSLGTINPVEEIIALAHKMNIPVMLDAAQAVNHIPVDVQKLNCDFLAFSGHKLYGPTGVGVLFGKEELLNNMPPYMGGGDMISKVTFEETTYNELPYKFEAGTPNVADVIGLGAALDYVLNIGMNNIFYYEKELLDYAEAQTSKIEGLRLIGTAKNKCSILSFVLDNVHPHDIGTFLDFEGIAVRTGHHCTQPVMDRLGIPATSRASFAFYNTKEEIDTLIGGLKKVMEVFR
jgi:cysteine desulfurase/selenocysteine lyase